MIFLVLGADRLAHAVIYDLIRSQHVEKIYLADSDQQKLSKIMASFVDERIVPCQVDISQTEEIIKLMSSSTVAISTLLNPSNYELSKMALRAGVHFCDMGLDEEIARMQFLLSDLAKEAKIAIVPGCGITPGVVSLLATNSIESLEKTYRVHIRIGRIPLEPQNPLIIHPLLSADKFLGECLEDVTTIRNGKLMRLPPLGEVEAIAMPAPFGDLEAFTTAGGITRFATSLGGKVDNFDFKSIHYRGYCQQAKLMRDAGLFSMEPVEVNSSPVVPRDFFAKLISQRALDSEPDAVLARVMVIGSTKEGDKEIVWECIDYMDQANQISAIAKLKAFPTSIVAQMLARKDISEVGTLAFEKHVPIKIFLAELSGRGIRIAMSEVPLSPEAPSEDK